MPQVELLLVGQVDAEPPLGGVAEDVPVVVQGGVDVDGDPHAEAGYRRRHGSAAEGPSRALRHGRGRAWLRRRLARAPALGRRRRAARVNVVDMAPDDPGAPHGLRPRALGLLAELARATCRTSRATTASSRWTCPASASREMPEEKITISGYGALRRRAARRARRRRARRSSATPWAASSARSWRSSFPRARRAPRARLAPPGCRSSTSATTGCWRGLERADELRDRVYGALVGRALRGARRAARGRDGCCSAFVAAHAGPARARR